jgi:cyclopropane-fatty-acyl-phospholipid synthase
MTSYTDVRDKESSGSQAGPMENWARRGLFRLLSSLHHGRIRVIDEKGVESFGNGQLRATITVSDYRAYTRMIFGGSIGAAEAYTAGMWRCDDLTSLVRIIVRNMGVLNSLESKFGLLILPFRKIQELLRSNSRSGSKNNILAHYDLGNRMYKSFLDPTMMYSSAIYPDPASSLETASVHKLEVICNKLNLTPGDRILEIGTGWGGFAIHAASRYGCHVTTTTISDAQYEEAQQRIRDAGLEDKITLLKQDYRDLDGLYDKLVSIEMIEAVGYNYLPDFFIKCERLLKPGGTMLLQAITMEDQSYTAYLRDYDFIRKHIFPGGCLVANSHMLDLLTRHTTMVVRNLEDFGRDYARTLRDWRSRFLASFEDLRVLGYDDTFRRLWEYYFSYCEGGFEEQLISVVHITATKRAY